MTSDKMTQESRKRIKTMVETNDGFKISEVDMELRGPGDILGTQQSGVIDFKKLDRCRTPILLKQQKNVWKSFWKQTHYWLFRNIRE